MTIIHAWQWDTDIPIKIPWSSAAVPELDFMPDTGTGYTVTPELQDGTLTAQCPPQLLTSSRPIQIYARLGNTIDRVGMVCIKPRPKPPDYIDTPEAVRTWEQLAERITTLEENPAGGITTESDPTVPEWAKQPDPPKMPDTLPNPHPLTITGAVSAEYDGSTPVTVEIPGGGGGGESVVLSEEVLAEGITPAGLGAYAFIDTGLKMQDILAEWKEIWIEVYTTSSTIINIMGFTWNCNETLPGANACYNLFIVSSVGKDTNTTWYRRCYAGAGNYYGYAHPTGYSTYATEYMTKCVDWTNTDGLYIRNYANSVTTADIKWRVCGLIKYKE